MTTAAGGHPPTAATPGQPVPTTSALVGEVHSRLLGLGHTVATAESLTGGLVAAALVDVPGASATVRGGVVAYRDDVKSEVLGVPPEVLTEHGAVSGACAEAMARGVRQVLGSDWGVATTGVAGPEPAEGKEVGTVHVAVAGEHGGAHRALTLHGTRAEVRAASVTAVVELLLDVLDTPLSVGQGTVDDHPGTTRTSRTRRDDDGAAAARAGRRPA